MCSLCRHDGGGPQCQWSPQRAPRLGGGHRQGQAAPPRQARALPAAQRQQW